MSIAARKTVRHSSCFKGYLLSMLKNRALLIPISQTRNWVAASFLPESGRGKYFSPGLSSTGASVGHGEPSKDVLGTLHILERQVSRKAKPSPFKSVFRAQHTWQVWGDKCLCRNTRGYLQKVEMLVFPGVHDHRQRLARGFAVHDSSLPSAEQQA